MVLAIGGSVPAWAQDAPRAAETNDILVVGHKDLLSVPTTTGSRLGLTPLETPASIAVLDSDKLRAQ